MKKARIKRALLGVLQHSLAAISCLLIAYVLVQSSVSAEFLRESHKYNLDPMKSYRSQFEETDIFTDLYTREAEDVLNFVALRILFESNGKMESSKPIDVTEYAVDTGTLDDCKVTAIYALEDLLAWSSEGLTYTTRTLSLSDFLTYFGRKRNFEEGEMDQEFTKIKSQLGDLISYSEERDGIKSVTFEMLDCPYQTTDGATNLTSLVTNWSDFFKLQRNLIKTLEEFPQQYQMYRRGLKLYGIGQTNLHYVIRIMDVNREKTYTNMSGLQDVTDDYLTELFSEHLEYLIFFADELQYTGLSEVDENRLFQTIKLNGSFYPEKTHIWMYVDTDYYIETDSFAEVAGRFDFVRSVLRILLVTLLIILVAWFSVLSYLTLTAGISADEDGEEKYYQYWVDRIWFELFLFLGAFLFLGIRFGFSLVENHLTQQSTYHYVTYGITGILVSVYSSLVLGSIARRLRSGNFFEHFFVQSCIHYFQNLGKSVTSNSSLVIHTLLPYNLFLLINLGGMFLFCRIVNDHGFKAALLLIILMVLDAYIGVFLFRHSSEKRDIIKGINRIRAGEVDYKIDTAALLGANEELGEAVNNIGEGIRRAVDASMRNEQMKTDLITNVSHDLKTPLTSIINYTNLLKRQKIEEEPAAGYIQILDEKSNRLKQLLDDLLEASKLSSGTLELHLERCNLVELMNQTIGEFEEKLQEKELQIVFEAPTSAIVYADGRSIWRVVDNLFQNVYKYAMAKTRVYVTLLCEGDKVKLAIKNVSEKQSSFQGQELTERFIRGDQSRSTEGSGLGLFIAKSLTEAQGGSFQISMDGDLFTVTMIFPEYSLEKVGMNPEAKEK